MSKKNTSVRLHKILGIISQNGPISPFQILSAEDLIPDKREPGKHKDRRKIIDNRLRNLRKTYLNRLEKDKKVFRLEIGEFIKYGELGSEEVKKISAREFIKNFYYKGGWGKEGIRNCYRSYYFATPLTSKWVDILNEAILKNIVNRFSEYLNQKEEIEAHIRELYRVFPYVEILPKIRGIHEPVSKKDFMKHKSEIFGFDIIEKDFLIHNGTTPLHVYYFTFLSKYLESLHIKLIKEKIMIKDVLADVFDEEVKKSQVSS